MFSLAVSGLLQLYFSSLNISSEITFGVLLWDEAARSGPEDFEGTVYYVLVSDCAQSIFMQIYYFHSDKQNSMAELKCHLNQILNKTSSRNTSCMA